MSSIEQLPDRRPPVISHNGRVWLPSLGLRVSERKVLLAVMDFLLLSASLITAVAVTTDLLPYPAALTVYTKWFVVLALLWAIIGAIFDLYNLARAASLNAGLRAAVPATAVTTLLYLTIPIYTPPIQNRSYGFLFVLLGTASVGVWRALYARAFIQPTFQRRALVVGAGNSGRALAKALQSDFARRDANPFQGTGYELVGFVDDNPERQEQNVVGIPVLGSSERLVRLVQEQGIDEVIISITRSHQIRPELFEAILDCREMGLPITTMTTVYERLTGRVAVSHASRNVEVASGRRDSPFDRANVMFHLLLDYLFAAIGLIVFLPATGIVYLANVIASPGPLFYRQKRVGQGGRLFTAIKFRSMVPDAEKAGAVWAKAEDERVTPVGRLLRSTHLDELPQVINVLRGEMSIVGPRPERPEFVARLSRDIPFYRARHCVRPGITGWAQIHQDYGDSLDRAREKLEYDLYYIKHATPLFDLAIILRTVSKVLGLRGR